MPEPFIRTFHVGWEHLDANGHMRNTAYLDLAVDVRMMFFQDSGFPMHEFERRRIGPVVKRDDIEYFREFRLLEPVAITLTLAGLSEDASHFSLRNEFFKSDGTLAARLSSTGGWLDLSARRLIAPPSMIIQALNRLVRTADYVTLNSSVG
jgi:acyl-CoA thioester hydrolase